MLSLLYFSLIVPAHDFLALYPCRPFEEEEKGPGYEANDFCKVHKLRTEDRSEGPGYGFSIWINRASLRY